MSQSGFISVVNFTKQRLSFCLQTVQIDETNKKKIYLRDNRPIRSGMYLCQGGSIYGGCLGSNIAGYGEIVKI